MKHHFSRKGFALLLVLGAGVASLFLVAVLSQMGSGLRNQVNIFNRKYQTFLIANYAHTKILGQLYSKPWLQRSFKENPVSEGDSYGGGVYKSMVENSPGHDMMFDTYVKVELHGKSTLFFWRTKYNDDLLDFSQTSFFGEFATDKFPENSSRIVADQVDQMMKTRKNNSYMANELGKTIAKAKSLSEIISELGGGNSSDGPSRGVPPSPSFPQEVFAQPNADILKELEKDSRFEAICKCYQTYLGRGPDVEGASYWLSQHPDVNTPEGFEEIMHYNPGLSGRRACLEKMNLQLPVDNTLLVYYEMGIHYHWVKHPELPHPSSPEFPDLAVNYAKNLPPMPSNFVVKELYFEREWDAFFSTIE